MTWALIAVFALAAWLHGYGRGANAVRREQEDMLIESAIVCAERDDSRLRLVEMK